MSSCQRYVSYKTNDIRNEEFKFHSPGELIDRFEVSRGNDELKIKNQAKTTPSGQIATFDPIKVYSYQLWARFC